VTIEPRTAGVILAGGLARRLGGGDKPLRAVGGRTILARAVERLGPQVDALALNANGDPERFRDFALPVLPDGVADHPGPLAGILAALRWGGEQDAEWVVTVPGDAPFLPRDLVSRLRAALGGSRLAFAASGGWSHPVVGLWPVALASDLAKALEEGTRKIDAFTGRYSVAVAEWPTEPVDPFFNANTPEDLAEAERLAQRHPGA